MSKSILVDDEGAFVAPAMRMWEWFDAWSLYQEAKQGLVESGELVTERSLLAESSPANRRRLRALRATGVVPKKAPEDMTPEEQHKFYIRHFKEIINDHTRMSPEESKARLAHVDKFRASKESPEAVAAKPTRVGALGHDAKSMSSAATVLHTLSAHKDVGRRLRSAVSRGKEGLVAQSDLPHDRKGDTGADPEATSARNADLDATLHGRALAGSSEDIQPSHWRQHRKALRLLAQRKATMDAEKKKDLDPDHPHNYAAIAAQTQMPEHEVKSLEAQHRAGTHATPIRELARQMLRKAEGYTRKSTGEEVPAAQIDHKTVGSALTRIMQKQHSQEGAQKGFLGKAVKQGSKPVKGADDSETTALDMAGDTPTPTRTALRMSKEQRGVKIHHPETKTGKEAAVTSASPEHHAALIKALNPDADEETLKKKGKESVDLHDTIDKLYKHHGKSAAEIAKLTGHPLAGVEGRIMGKRSGPKAAIGGGSGHGDPTVTKLTSKEQDVKKGKALSPSAAVQADLHDLYPLRTPGKEAEFAGKVHSMYHGDASKGVPAKPHPIDARTTDRVSKKDEPAGDEPEAPETPATRKKSETTPRLGMFGSPTKAHAGFAVGKKGALNHPGTAPEGATPAKTQAHQEKSSSFHDTLATAHEKVHGVMKPILAAMADPRHPENVRHKAHHSELERARVAGDSNKVAALEAEGKKKNIKADLLDHHLNLAADKPEVQSALGVSTDKHARSALSNIFKRVEQHGKNYMKTAQAHGAGEQKAHPGAETNPKRRQTQRPGDPFSRARVRVPEAGAGGDVESPEHKPEKFEEPDKKPSMASRVLDTRHQQDRSAHVPAEIKKTQSDQGRALAQVRAAKKPTTRPNWMPAKPKAADDAAHETAAKGDIERAQKARATGAEPGTAGGVRPKWKAGPEALTRVRPTAGGEVHQQASAGRSAPGVFKPAPAAPPKKRKKRPELATPAPQAPAPAPQEPHNESAFVRQPLVLSEGRTLLNRLAGLV